MRLQRLGRILYSGGQSNKTSAPRRKKCTSFANRCRASHFAGVENLCKMKAQLLQPEGVLELVPQVLNLKKILVPIDFSPMSKQALQYSVRFAEQFGCEIVLLHVIEPVTAIAGAPLAVDIFAQPEEDTIAAEAELACLAASSGNRPNSFTSAVRIGHAPNEITKAAKELDVDLIMIPTHGYTSWRHLCIGSTAERVVRTAPCPVLVVREKEHEFC